MLCMSFSGMSDDGAREELALHLLGQRRCLGCWTAALVGNGEAHHVHTLHSDKGQVRFTITAQSNIIPHNVESNYEQHILRA